MTIFMADAGPDDVATWRSLAWTQLLMLALAKCATDKGLGLSEEAIIIGAGQIAEAVDQWVKVIGVVPTERMQ
jgi:hypothetical protein